MKTINDVSGINGEHLTYTEVLEIIVNDIGWIDTVKYLKESSYKYDIVVFLKDIDEDL